MEALERRCLRESSVWFDLFFSLLASFSASFSLHLLLDFGFLDERLRSERSEESLSLCLFLVSMIGEGIGEMDWYIPR